MKTSDFRFDLPEELIAQYPMDERTESRLLVLDRRSESITHTVFRQLGEYLPSHGLMILNNARVRKARIIAETETGGRTEFLLCRRISPKIWEAIGTRGGRRKIGKSYTFPGHVKGGIIANEGMTHVVEFDTDIDDVYLDRYGTVPLPPYIRRKSTAVDEVRYQTVFSETTGSAAAPTAGLHFSCKLLDDLTGRGIRYVFLTLHVGLGTFLPIRTENIEDHSMHVEEYSIPENTAEMINGALKDGVPVTAVGTTTVRTLESAWHDGKIKAGDSETGLFIYPGYRFKVVSSLITNFHTPESSLLVMVSAFAGKELIQKAYAEAIKERYRFFSYGDAMLII